VIASLFLIAALSAAAPVAGELSTQEVTIQYTGRARGAAAPLLEQVQASKEGFQRVLGQRWPRRITVRLGAGREELEALAPPGQEVPKLARAVAYPEQDTMLLDAVDLSSPDGPATVRHELTHLALGQLGRFPHWFHEGLAVLLSDEGYDVTYYAAMYRGVRNGRIASFEDLGGAWPDHRAEAELAYAQSASFASFLTDRHGPEAFDELFQRVRAGEPFEIAFAKAFHASIGTEEGAWKRTLERRYGTIPLATLISLLWSCSALLCVAAFLRRRAQKERNLRRMDEEAALEALLLTAAEPGPAGEPEPEPEPEPGAPGGGSEPPVLH
jgi:hypothetical protein